MPWRSCLGLILLLLAACAGGAACGADEAPSGGAPAAGFEADAEPSSGASCFDYSAWEDAQADLDFDSELEEALDEDYDGVACNDLAQEAYEAGWPNGYAEACEAVFTESPDGVLYLDGTSYEQYECEGTDPGPSDWQADPSGEPETDGARDGWATACDEFFNSYVGGDLFWGDDLVATQYDCDLANAY